MLETHLKILQHSLGYRNGNPPAQWYRNHYCCDENTPSHQTLKEMHLEGTVEIGTSYEGSHGRQYWYHVTEQGMDELNIEQGRNKILSRNMGR